MTANQAAWIDGKGQNLRVGPSETSKPGKGELLIRNRAVAICPVECKVQELGYMLQKWPNIMGLDTAGEVVEVGEGVMRFKEGDRVISSVTGLLTQEPRHGGFQLFTVAPAAQTAILPDKISFAEGAVVPLAFATALIGLSSGEGKGLGLPLPSLDPKPTGKTLLVWGGSSSVGAFVIQLAVAAGMKVIAVASSRNFDLCKRLGASAVFDYNAPSVADDVVKAVQTSGGEYVGTYNSVSTLASFEQVLPIISRLGGGNVINTQRSVRLDPVEGVNVIAVFGAGPLTHPFFENYITPALESGQLKCVPEPYVVGKGLENIQKGLDVLKKGVSAKKVVIEL